MVPIKTFEQRCREILEELDALAEDSPVAEDLEELNAELEDALMLLGEIRQEDADWREELDGTLEELEALAGDYRALAGHDPALSALADRLAMAARFAADNLPE